MSISSRSGKTVCPTCNGCRADGVDLDFTMAFQPIVDAAASRVWGYEALVRGPGGEPAPMVLSQVNDENRYRFDQACRVKAIEAAGRLFGDDKLKLSINFLPNAVYEPAACIRTSLAAADRAGLNRSQLMFEFTENERMSDGAHVTRIVEAYKRFGFTTAIDDFGNGYAGMTLLTAFTPDLIKIDMALVRGIDESRSRQVIVTGIVGIARQLGIEVLAEGVETRSEARLLRGLGIALMQGYLFARPEMDRLPLISWPMLAAAELMSA